MKLTISLLFIFLCNTALAEGDFERGRNLSQNCIGCHGSNGISTVESNPNLAGQKEAYIRYALKSYRDGIRTGGLAIIMQANASSLSDHDIDDLAHYFSNIDDLK